MKLDPKKYVPVIDLKNSAFLQLDTTSSLIAHVDFSATQTQHEPQMVLAAVDVVDEITVHRVLCSPSKKLAELRADIARLQTLDENANTTSRKSRRAALHEYVRVRVAGLRVPEASIGERVAAILVNRLCDGSPAADVNAIDAPTRSSLIRVLLSAPEIEKNYPGKLRLLLKADGMSDGDIDLLCFFSAACHVAPREGGAIKVDHLQSLVDEVSRMRLMNKLSELAPPSPQSGVGRKYVAKVSFRGSTPSKARDLEQFDQQAEKVMLDRMTTICGTRGDREVLRGRFGFKQKEISSIKRLLEGLNPTGARIEGFVTQETFSEFKKQMMFALDQMLNAQMDQLSGIRKLSEKVDATRTALNEAARLRAYVEGVALTACSTLPPAQKAEVLEVLEKRFASLSRRINDWVDRPSNLSKRLLDSRRSRRKSTVSLGGGLEGTARRGPIEVWWNGRDVIPVSHDAPPLSLTELAKLHPIPDDGSLWLTAKAQKPSAQTTALQQELHNKRAMVMRWAQDQAALKVAAKLQAYAAKKSGPATRYTVERKNFDWNDPRNAKVKHLGEDGRIVAYMIFAETTDADGNPSRTLVTELNADAIGSTKKTSDLDGEFKANRIGIHGESKFDRKLEWQFLGAFREATREWLTMGQPKGYVPPASFSQLFDVNPNPHIPAHGGADQRLDISEVGFSWMRTMLYAPQGAQNFLIRMLAKNPAHLQGLADSVNVALACQIQTAQEVCNVMGSAAPESLREMLKRASDVGYVAIQDAKFLKCGNSKAERRLLQTRGTVLTQLTKLLDKLAEDPQTTHFLEFARETAHARYCEDAAKDSANLSAAQKRARYIGSIFLVGGGYHSIRAISGLVVQKQLEKPGLDGYPLFVAAENIGFCLQKKHDVPYLKKAIVRVLDSLDEVLPAELPPDFALDLATRLAIRKSLDDHDDVEFTRLIHTLLSAEKFYNMVSALMTAQMHEIQLVGAFPDDAVKVMGCLRVGLANKSSNLRDLDALWSAAAKQYTSPACRLQLQRIKVQIEQERRARPEGLSEQLPSSSRKRGSLQVDSRFRGNDDRLIEPPPLVPAIA